MTNLISVSGTHKIKPTSLYFLKYLGCVQFKLKDVPSGKAEAADSDKESHNQSDIPKVSLFRSYSVVM